MTAGANYIVVHRDPTHREPLVIRDVGLWPGHPTVTNDIEAIVRILYARRLLRSGQRLLYYDSDGDLTAVEHDGGRFVAFANATDEEIEAWRATP